MSTTFAASTTTRYRRRVDRTIVEAMRYSPETCAALHAWVDQAHDAGECAYAFERGYGMELTTPFGLVTVHDGDYVIRENGSFFRRTGDTFDHSYQPCEPEFTQADCERICQVIGASPWLSWGDVRNVLEAAVTLGLVEVPA